MEALNSVLGLLLIYYSLSLYKSYKNGYMGRGFKYLAVASLLIAIREAGYIISRISSLGIFMDLITTLMILALTYSVIQFRSNMVELVSTIKDEELIRELRIK